MKKNYKCSCGYEAKYEDMIMIQTIEFESDSWKCPNCKTINYLGLYFKPETIKKELYPDQNEAKKFDQGKDVWTALPWRALSLCARGMTHGMHKYAKHNYLGLEADRCIDAALRHVSKYLCGEVIDKDSGLPHLTCAANELLMTQEIIINNEEKDDKEQFKWAK